ncbi:MAG: metallophosphoesterase [Alistipes senegalensis]|nr:metallophosphoesterase [Bacteroides cellulosilyticus]MCM1352510.1 metallophosphoesterase [Alistipes senegalensis]
MKTKRLSRFLMIAALVFGCGNPYAEERPDILWFATEDAHSYDFGRCGNGCFATPPVMDGSDGSAVSAESPLFTFGVVTDVHYSSVKETWAARHYTESEEKLREAVATFNRAHVDFVVSLGDMIDGDVGSYAVIRPILEQSAAPVYKILGNHDYLEPYGSEEQRHVLEVLGISDPYFSVSRNGYRLLFLDSNDLSVYARAKDSPEYEEAVALLDSLKRSGAANARQYNGAIGKAQRAWLVRELSAAESRGERVICFAHMPLMPPAGQFTLWNNMQIAALLQKYACVRAFLAGHHHKGGVARFGSVLHFTFQGMIEGLDNHYAIVEVYPEKFVIRGYGVQPDETICWLQTTAPHD